jgi:thymidine kinase
MGVLLEKTHAGCSHTVFEQDMTLPQANGSALSITNWARLAKLDPEQTRAFEVFAASFILTFFRDAENTMDASYTRRQRFRKEKLRLTKLAGRLPVRASLIRLAQLAQYLDKNLVCLLHGPGGSGKTAVMALLCAYSKEYCDFVDVIFTAYTIILSALTGVAATLINGRTIHSVAHLNKLMKTITRTEKDQWRHTRLLIIDEVSFASQQLIIKIDQKLKYLTDNPTTLYGGLNVIFSGDFWQLESITEGAIQIYEEEFIEFHGAINSYIELRGMHRFCFDLPWGKLLTRLRDEAIFDSDI